MGVISDMQQQKKEQATRLFIVTAPVVPSLLALTCFRGQICLVWGGERYQDCRLDIVAERVVDLVGATGTPHSDQGYWL